MRWPAPAGHRAVVLLDSVSGLGPGDAGAVVVTGSHGGSAAMRHLLHDGPRAVICHDGGVGRDGAGIAGLDLAPVPAAAVDGRTARVGDARDVLARGVIGAANPAARGIGIEAGMGAEEALRRMAAAVPPTAPGGPRPAGRGTFDGRLAVADSISLLAERHRGAVAVVGSHGAAETVAIGAAVGLAGLIHHDAGAVEDGGCDAHGISGLTLWDAAGVPAAAVSGRSARIGDGADVLARGVLSAANAAAAARGLRAGMSARAAVVLLLNSARRADERPVLEETEP